MLMVCLNLFNVETNFLLYLSVHALETIKSHLERRQKNLPFIKKEKVQSWTKDH